LKKGLTKAEALRQSQLILLHGDAKGQAGKKNISTVVAPRSKVVGGASATNSLSMFKHPYFWAPFILIGNWQ
jgi:CHAT domain-containing protein